MQLLIILALLLYGGKSGAQNILNEVKPMLENFGGEEVQKALKSAEEISQVLNVVQGFTGAFGSPPQPKGEDEVNTPIGFPLSPISKIADKDITYSLSQYVNQA